MPAMASGIGRLMTRLAQRRQNGDSRSLSTMRFGSTRRLLMRWPMIASSAGSRVIAAITETSGISRPPMPIERITGTGMMTMLTRPIATVEPETITERPACFIVSTSASSTVSPCESSSRKRKIISSA